MNKLVALALLAQCSDYCNFQTVINKTKIACENSGQVINNHFVHVDEMVVIGSGAERSIETIFLSRYACYLIVFWLFTGAGKKPLQPLPTKEKDKLVTFEEKSMPYGNKN